MITKHKTILAGMLVLALILSGCGRAVTPSTQEAPLVPITGAQVDTATDQPAIIHTLQPGEVPVSRTAIIDTDTSPAADQKRTTGGDSLTLNRYERPFSQDMELYYPGLDILSATQVQDAVWAYVTIALKGNAGSDPLFNYGIEVDLDLDGRGDLLLVASALSPQWSTDGVRAWEDANGDVGAARAIRNDADTAAGNADGYEALIFDQGLGDDADAAWARIDPSDGTLVQFAIKLSLLNDDTYAWGAWASHGALEPGWFDYNDYFTTLQAGSPIRDDPNYPLNALFALDNTCRWAVGFTPGGNEPGICPPLEPPATATPIPQPTAIPLGGINGIVFYDFNTDGNYDSGTDGVIAGSTVTVYAGTCGGSVVGSAVSDAGGSFTVSGLPAGTYCLAAAYGGGWNYYTGNVTLTLGPGAYSYAPFGFATILY